MSTTITILGGVGLFLLGMAIMTDGLKGLAGSSLRTVLAKAARTPLTGAFWGAVVTLLVQSSSATTMTTIGLVSAGLLTFPQGLGLVFGANVGTTGTGWLVALLGVRVSLSSYALPIIFVGALLKLLTSGRLAAAGASLAGFALVLYGLTTLQEGMGGLAEQLHPADLPSVLGAHGTSFFSGLAGLLSLVVVGLVMTAVMQSSTAAIAITLSAYFAGAIGFEQGCALIIGQNIGTATSSALAAIGASTTAKRLAIAYILFKVIAALIALILFPFTIPLLARAVGAIDGATLLAAYHTAYNVVGVAVLLPLFGWFTRFVERFVPERGAVLTRRLDRAALANPVVAIEAVRRTVAMALQALCGSMMSSLDHAGAADSVPSISAAAEALEQAREFLSEVSGPSTSEEEELRLTSTLHALDHASRFADIAREELAFEGAKGGSEDERVVQFFEETLGSAALAVSDVADETGLSDAGEPIKSLDTPSAASALTKVQQGAQALRELRRAHRSTTLGAVAKGLLTAEEAMASVDFVRRLDAAAHHAWRSAAHLNGRGDERLERAAPVE